MKRILLLVPLILISCSKDFKELKEPEYEYINGRDHKRELASPADHLVPTQWEGYAWKKDYNALMQCELFGPGSKYGWGLSRKEDGYFLVLYFDEKEIEEIKIRDESWVNDLYEFWVNMLYQVRYPKFVDPTHTMSLDGIPPAKFVCMKPGVGLSTPFIQRFAGESLIHGGDSKPAIMVRSAIFVFKCASSGSIHNKDFHKRMIDILEGKEDNEPWIKIEKPKKN